MRRTGEWERYLASRRKQDPKNVRRWTPADETLMGWMRELGSYKEVAIRCGVSPSALRGYLADAPALKSAVRAIYEEYAASRRPPPGWRKCFACASVKPIDEFYARTGYCIECERERNRIRHMARERAGRRMGVARDDARLYESALRADPCAYCGGPGGTLDHIAAQLRGGTDSWENLTGACTTCNEQKWAHSLLIALLRVRLRVENPTIPSDPNAFRRRFAAEYAAPRAPTGSQMTALELVA